MRVVDLSMSHHGGRDELSMPTQLPPTVPGLPLSVTLTDVYGSLDLTSPSTMSCKCNFA